MAQTINLQEIARPSGAAAAVDVVLQGFKDGEDVALTFWEDDTKDSLIPSTTTKSVQKIGIVEGTVVQLSARPGFPPLLSLTPKKTTPVAKSSLKLVVSFRQPAGSPPVDVELFLPAEKVDVFEGESWEVFTTVESAPNAVSPTTRLARVRRALSVQKGDATYSFYVGNICRFHHDGSTGPSGAAGYFHELDVAIREAVDFIFIADWSFHPHMRLRHGGSYDFPSTVGAILIDKARSNPDIVIAIHAWDHTNIGAPDAQNDDGGDELDRIAQMQFGLSKRPDNLLWRKSSRTGFGYSHHQKFVVMDAKHDQAKLKGLRRMRAFLGGLDVTKGRFDWGDHSILTKDPGGAVFEETLAYVKAGPHVYDDWYNAEFFSLDAVPKPPPLPRQPWHDIAVHFVGPACWDVVREFVGRWRLDPSSFPAFGDTGKDAIRRVVDKYKDLFQRLQNPGKPHNPFTNRHVYVQQWEPAGGPWAIQLYRSLPREHWESTPPLVIPTPDRTRREFRWTVNGNSERSIQLAYINAIRQAESYIYIETQYFISSGSMWGRSTVSNPIAINLAKQAIARAKQKAPFHIYLIVPMFPEGKPDDGSNCAQRQFQWKTIQAMAQMIESQSGRKAAELLSVFFVARWHDLGGKLPSVSRGRTDNVRANERYQIYVHSKFMLIDDRYMIIGSANLNERSLNGSRDSEIAVGIWPSDDSTIRDCITDARAFRRGIWSEHLGPKFPPADFDKPGSPACIAAVRDAAAENYAAFREGRLDSATHGHLCLWPLEPDINKEPVRSVSKAPELDGMIPDRPFGLSGTALDAWRWHAPGTWSGKVLLGGHIRIKTFTDPGDETAE